MSDILSLQITNSFKIPVDTRYDWYILLMSIDEMKETHYKNFNLNPPRVKNNFPSFMNVSARSRNGSLVFQIRQWFNKYQLKANFRQRRDPFEL